MRYSRFCSLLLTFTCFSLISMPSIAADKIGVVFYFGQEVTLYDDGSWEPADPDVTFFAGTPLVDGHCLITNDKLVKACAVPDGYDNPDVYFENEYHSIDFYNGEGTITLGAYEEYGHNGEMSEFFASEATQLSLSQKMLASVFNVKLPTEDVVTYEFADTVFTVSNTVPSSSDIYGEFTTYIDIYTHDDNLDLNISNFSDTESGVDIQAQHREEVAFMLANTFIYDRSLQSIIAERQNMDEAQ